TILLSGIIIFKILLSWLVLGIFLGLIWQIIKPWILPRIRRFIWQQLIDPKSFLRGELGKFLVKLR
ncbi:MAG: hypothetical protein ACRDEA_14555, partial [Microcystaceae cyanobacterium]